MTFYSVRGPAPWGDYGKLLAGGMSRVYGRSDDELIRLARTGPFIPPITFPGFGDVVVTDDFRIQLESSDLASLQFRPVIKLHIVEYSWESWDWSADIPETPIGGEPENYVLDREHSEEVANEMGELYEVIAPVDAKTESIRRNGRLGFDVLVDLESWGGSHMFCSERRRGLMVSDIGRKWLEDRAGEKWFRFEECKTK